MRIALVSPYSWSYPGGVTRHIEALAEQFMAGGHHVRVLAPYDPPDRLSARMHRGARPEARELPDWVIPLGRTIGVKSNGAVSNLPHTPFAITTLRRELRAGRFDVIHVHEPVAPVVGYDVLDTATAPLVGTFHCYSENVDLQHDRQRLRRQAQAPAPARAHRRLRGRRVDRPALLRRQLPDHPQRGRRPRRASDAPRRGRRARRCAWPSSARPSSARGFPSCCAPSRRCATTSPVELIVVGADRDEVEPLMLDGTQGVNVLGKVSDAEKAAALASADLLVAPSLGGESFGMVLTEAFAAGTPVVASDIPGYRDVVRDGVDGVLFPRGDATALAETLRDLAVAPERRAAMAVEARAHAPRYAWPTVAGEVLEAYTDAVAMPRASHRPRARGRVPRRHPGRSRAAPARRAAPAQPRGVQARGPRSPPRGRPQGRDRPRRARRRVPGPARAAAHRAGPDRRQPAAGHADLGAARPGPDVRLDGRARRGVARDPHRGAARGAPAALRRPAGHVHRRAHVGHAARATRASPRAR